MSIIFHFISCKYHAVKVTACLIVFFYLSLSADVLWPGEKAKVSNPSKFKVNLSLPKAGSSSQSSSGRFAAQGFSSGSSQVKANISVNILDERFYPVKAFVLREIKNKNRIESLWDGRDVYGREMPAGNYYASLSITYSDGAKESKFYKFVKE